MSFARVDRAARGALVALSTAALLVACGGNDSSPSSDPGTPVVTVAAPPVAKAGAAETVLQGATLTFDGSASSDSTGRTLAYAWSIASKPVGSAATLAAADTPHPTITVDVAGTYVASLTVGNGVASSTPSTVTITATAFAPLAIVANQADPVSGTVDLALSGDLGAGVTIVYRVDGVSLTSAQNGYATWPTATAADGTHQVTAHLQIAANAFIDVGRTFTVRQTPITIAPLIASAASLFLQPMSPYGIARVTVTLDGVDIGTLTAPNADIRSGLVTSHSAYSFAFAPILRSGRHVASVVVVDARGNSDSPVVDFDVSNAPVLSLAAPFDGMFAAGTLPLRGAATIDRAGVVNVTARLHGYQSDLVPGDPIVFQTTGPTFDANVDLTAFPAGVYTLQVDATDPVTNETATVARQVVVASSAALAYQPLLALGQTGALLAADGNQLLYRASDGRVHSRDTSAATEVLLADVPGAQSWQAGAGFTYASAHGTDCPLAACVYQWDATGAFANLSLGNLLVGAVAQSHPVARDRFVAWADESPGGSVAERYTLYDSVARSYVQIAEASDVLPGSNTFQFDLGVVGGTAAFVHAGVTGIVQYTSTQSGPSYDVYSWDSATRTSTKRSVPGLSNVGPQTDGSRVAWSQAPVGLDTLMNPATLMAAGLPTGPASTVSSTMNTFALRDGVLAWLEVGGTQGVKTIEAATSGGGVIVSATTQTVLYGTGGGRVLYGELGRLYSWDAATGLSTLVLDTLPTRLLQSGRIVYFTYGADAALYRATLR